MVQTTCSREDVKTETHLSITMLHLYISGLDITLQIPERKSWLNVSGKAYKTLS